MTSMATEGAEKLKPCRGHDGVLDVFRRTLARNRLASTYLFTGDEGVGKRTAAHQLAGVLLCPRADLSSMQACGTCQACELLAAGTHPDLIAVARPEGKATLPLDLLIGGGDKRNREGLCHDIALKPMLGLRRIAIIDDADYLSVESGNCLLKTLEEPPPGSVLLLIATSPSRVLPTIRSRSQVVRFASLDEPTVAAVLLQIGACEDAAEAQRLAALSGGSVSRALVADDPDLLAISEPIRAAMLSADFDPVALTAQLQELITGAGADAATRRRRLAAAIDLAITALRGVLRDHGHPPGTALARLEACLDAQEHLVRNANQATLVQWWIDRLWQAAPARSAPRRAPR